MSLKKSLTRFLPALLCGLLAAGVVPPVYSQETGQRELKTQSSETLDAVLLLDASGSMLMTDPERLRDQGVRLFLESLRAGDRLGIIQFSSDARVVRALSDYDPQTSAAIAGEISSIRNEGIYTDILAAINLAKVQLDENGREEANRVIVLLSDGKMEPDPAAGTSSARTQELLENVIPALRSSDVKVYTLYFSDLADKGLLTEIASGTNGLNWFTPSADKIHESYTNLFLSVKKPQVVPLTSKGFKIDGEVQEATFYMNREGEGEVALLSPSGLRLSAGTVQPDVRWFRSEKFDVVTVQTPEVGSWQVQGLSAHEGFATVLTNLKLVSDWDTSIYAGSKALLQARLYDNEKPVVLPEMTGAGHYAYQIVATDRVAEPLQRELLVDDGTSGDKIARDGIFSRTISVEEPGEYRLTILMRHPTFERTQQIPFRVKPRFVTLSVVEKEAAPQTNAQEEGVVQEIGEEGTEGKRKYFSLTLNPEASSISKLNLRLFATDEERRRFELPLGRAPGREQVYQVSVSYLPHEGEFELKGEASGELRKVRIEEESNVLQYKHVPLEGEQPQVQVVSIKEKAPPPKPFTIPWWVFGIIVSGLNIPIGFLFLNLFKKSQTQLSLATPTFESSEKIEAALAALEQKAALTEIDIDSPAFSDVSAVQAAPAKETESAAPVPETTAAAGDQNQPAPPAEEAETAGEAPEASETEEAAEGQAAAEEEKDET